MINDHSTTSAPLRLCGNSRPTRGHRLIAALLVLAALAAGAAEDPLRVPSVWRGVALQAIPDPDLSQAEPAVQQTLREARENLVKSLQAPDITAGQLADAFGATCGFYLVYRLWEPAGPCYANAEALAPGDYRWPYYLGYRHEQDGHPEQAAAAFERSLALRPDYAPARVRLARAYLELGRAGEAEPMLQDALGDPGLRGPARFALGRAALARNDHAAAARELEAVLTEQPEASRVRYPLAMAYRGLGRVEDARAQLAQRGEGEPRFVDPLLDELQGLLTGTRTLFYRGIEAVRNGHFDAAVAAFAEGLGREPGNVNARVTLARARYLTGDRDRARRELDEALARQPDHDLGLFLRGVLAEEDGNPEEAARFYERALAAAPEHPGASQYLGNARMRAGRYEEAAKLYATAWRDDLKNMTARLYEALALTLAGHDRTARERLERAVADVPDDPMPRLGLARLLAASRDDTVRDGARALPLAQALFDGFPSLEHAETLAMALAEVGRLEDAASLQENAVQAVVAAGRFDALPRVQAALERYRQGQPARQPWSASEPMLYPPPGQARGPFLQYPTLSAY